MIRRASVFFTMALFLSVLSPGIAATGIQAACKSGDINRVKAILRSDPGEVKTRTDYGMIPKGFQLTPLHWAARGGFTDIIDLLLERGAEVDARNAVGATPLHLASLRGNASAAARLIKAGAGLAATDSTGLTPLHMAALYGSDRTIDLLLSKESPLEALDNEGQTPLHIAVRHGNLAAADRLLHAGASVNRVSKEGAAALHFAAESNDPRLINRLLEAKADVNIRDAKGRTPLHIAARMFHQPVAEALLDHGADPNARDLADATPLFALTRSAFWNRLPSLRRPKLESDKLDGMMILLLQRGADPDLLVGVSGSAASLTSYLLGREAWEQLKVRSKSGIPKNPTQNPTH
ncbi:MAG: ankyrin repeat domain-containing protein [Candidatus Ozemobacteraceae bacterium]